MSEPAAQPTSIAIAVVEHEDRFLIGLRPVGAQMAGYWEFPGGKVRLSETPQAAAVRECREETGLDVIVGEEFPTVTHDYSYGRLKLRFFACRPVNPAAAVAGRFRWVSRGELASYRFPEANTELMKRLTAGSAALDRAR